MGDDVTGGILEFAKDKKLEGAWLSVIGGSKKVELSFYDLEKKEYLKKVFEDPVEILQASGTIAVAEGKPVLHLHGVFGRADFSTFGGHIHQLTANATAEVFIHKFNESLGRTFSPVRSVLPRSTLGRKHDPKTGLNLLD